MSLLDFSKIKNMSTSDDMIFRAFLKYKITEKNSLEFVKKYLVENPVRDNRMGISITKLFTPDLVPQIINKMENGKEYVCKMEADKKVFYITLSGIVRLMDDDFKEVHDSDDLKALFYNVLLVCVYETNMKEKEKDRVVF